MAILSTDQAAKFNTASPAEQIITMGDLMREVQQRTGMDETLPTSFSPLILFNYSIAADTTTSTAILTVPFACEVLDVFVQCRAANASGTATLRNGTTNPITNAMIMAVDKTMVRAGTIDDAYSILAAGTTLNVICNGASDRGLLTILFKKS